MKSLWTSKKFVMAIAGLVAVVVGNFYAPGEAIVMQVAGIVSAYLVAQGIADNGKSAAIIDKA